MNRRLALILGIAALASACSNEAARTQGGRESGLTESRAGASNDVMLSSDVDGEIIAFTVHEPELFEPDRSYPLILEGHGYGGFRYNQTRRGSVPPAFRALLDAGYGVISIDQRGHGASGGTARLQDPEFEGRDLLQIVDWAEANLPWLAFRDGNLVLGAIGESYGGGFQHLLHRVDTKRRLDALAPDITWHDLRRSFFEGGVFKSAYGAFFQAVPIEGRTRGADTRPDPLVTQLLAEGVALNRLTDEQLDFLYQRSPISACEAGTLAPVDIFYTQSAHDTLFSVNEAYDNVRCYRALGGDVRLWIKPQGHSVPVGGGGGTPSQDCGERNRDQALVAWFDEKLKGIAGAADNIPRVCLHLGIDGGDSIIAEDLTVGSDTPVAIAPQSMTLQDGSMTELVLPLLTAEQAQILGGIPTVELSILDATPGALEAGDPVLFIGLGLTRGGVVLSLNFLRAVRGYGSHSIELPAAFERLQAGDVVSLRLRSGSVGLYPGAGSRTPVPVTVEARVGLPLRAAP